MAYYIFRVLSYAAGTGALALYVARPATQGGWVVVLVGVSFCCFVVTWFLMLWIRLRR